MGWVSRNLSKLERTARLFRSPAGKVGTILGLLLLMQIPLMMVGGLIGEREARQGEVLAGFRRGWGPEQTVAGPVLVVPYSWPDTPARASDPPRRLHGWVRIPSARLQLAATLQPETRRRGLFHAVVYGAAVELGGVLTVPALDLRDAPGAVIDWAAARVVLAASDLRGLPAEATMEWNGAAVGLAAADGRAGCHLALLEAPAGFTAAPAPGTAIPFKAILALRGTQAFRVVPVGRQIEMQLASPWTTPSFTGATLPLSYDLGAAGFTARWEITDDAATSGWQQRDRPLPDCTTGLDPPWFDADAQPGVELQEAVPTYLMVSRAAKYGVLFLALSYLTLFLFETLARVRIHLVQYGLLGLSVSLFGLLLISIAEPLGFSIAYAVSTLAVLAQASLYTLSVVRRGRLAAVFAGVLGGLFGFLYVVLSLDAYALLAGTLALFVILSVVMMVTRQVNWAGTATG